ncbi:MAG: VCBS repeat-containing protein [Myxococcales bacterium]|nr:VCBS repeat-containing protein [Myxococcales bacterium]
MLREGHSFSFKLALALALTAPCACRYAPTQCEILFDTNVDRARASKLEVYVLRGALTIDEVRARLAGSATGALTYRGSGWPVTATVVPPSGGPRSGVVTVFATMDVGASSDRGATQIERLHRFSLVERQPQRGRIVFDTRCTDRAQGCTTAGECTVSRRCLELGATCGDNGECVNVELPVVTTPAPSERDGSFGGDATVADVTVQRDDAGPSDVSANDSASDAADVADAPSDSGLDIDAIRFRPVSPMSGSVTSSQQPTLRWSNTNPSIQSTVELCRDRACTTPTLIDADGNAVRPPAALTPGAWFWRVRARLGARRSTMVSAQWQLWIPARAATPDTDTVLGTRFDCNGDGIADIVGSGPLAVRGGVSSAGVVHVWHGAVTPPTSPARTLTGTNLRENFGASIADAGDVNGDGYSDLVIGATFYDPGGMPGLGAARVYTGSPTGISAAPWFTITGRVAGDRLAVVTGGGDFNGDGYGDVAVGAPTGTNGTSRAVGYVLVYQGGRDTMQLAAALTEADSFGSALAVVGDRDGDQFPELAVGQPRAMMAGSEIGSVLVYRGSPSGLTRTPTIVTDTVVNTRFAESVGNGGDINGDGLAELLVGVPGASPMDRLNVGELRVFYGRDALPVQSITGRVAGDEFGSTVSTAGDINASGRWSVLVGAPIANPMSRTRAGEVHLFFASVTGLLAPAVRVLPGSGPGDELGRALGGPGDVNGDGRADMLVGLPTANTGRGAISVLAGDNDAINPARSFVVNGELDGDRLGGAVLR